MDTLIGLGFGFFCIVVSILWAAGWDPNGVILFIDMPSVFVTIGGCMAAVLVAHPFGDWANALGGIGKLFGYKLDNPAELIKKLVRYAELARKNGILALDGATDPGDDPFMAKGIQLAVDGIDPDAIKETMETELLCMQQRHQCIKRWWDSVAKYAPAYGMIGTLIGLVLMLKNLSDVNAIGPAMAVALITTFYGAILANLIATPFADKLMIRDEQETKNKEIIINGVLSIQSGDNPRMVEQKLKIYLPPKLRAPDAA